MNFFLSCCGESWLFSCSFVIGTFSSVSGIRPGRLIIGFGNGPFWMSYLWRERDAMVGSTWCCDIICGSWLVRFVGVIFCVSFWSILIFLTVSSFCVTISCSLFGVVLALPSKAETSGDCCSGLLSADF